MEQTIDEKIAKLASDLAEVKEMLVQFEQRQGERYAAVNDSLRRIDEKI